jgi:hypothetical protein
MSARGLDNISMEVAMYLDVSKRYSYIDKNEVQWAFTYQDLATDKGWYVWRTMPGQTEVCIGRIDEAEIVYRLGTNPPLTQDDLIDLELWLSHGGLDTYQPRKKPKKTKEVKED